MEMLDENTVERIMEMEQVLVNINSMIETTNSGINTLERYNVGLKKEEEVLMLSTGQNCFAVAAKESQQAPGPV
ncbi:hypothetical protein MTR67_040905 [Solanum verrucosum]|uniref:Uncharacterized protein n=1 Tax=Solanum verrucosum TaxID=315347 RepID=A0AAF0UKK0_SOLVR|nr:hypothetical protein MTR67_040905 [Solanum verrucosum]